MTVEGPQFNPRWLVFCHKFSEVLLSLFHHACACGAQENANSVVVHLLVVVVHGLVGMVSSHHVRVR